MDAIETPHHTMQQALYCTHISRGYLRSRTPNMHASIKYIQRHDYESCVHESVSNWLIFHSFLLFTISLNKFQVERTNERNISTYRKIISNYFINYSVMHFLLQGIMLIWFWHALTNLFLEVNCPFTPHINILVN